MKTKILYLVCIVLASLNVTGQSKTGDKQYNGMAYINAIKTYERMVNGGKVTSPEILKNLGNSYYFNADLLKAGSVYKKLMELSPLPEVEPEYYYRYAQCLKAAKEYKQADEMIAAFNKKSGNDDRAKLALAQKDYLTTIMRNSGKYAIEDAGINSQYSDYGSAFYNGKVVFASGRPSTGTEKLENNTSWTGEKFTNLYKADMDLSGKLSNVDKLASKINSEFNESTPVYTKDGNTMYFTRNNFLNGKRKSDAQKTTLLKVYKATLDSNGKWGNLKSLPFNSDDYSVAHPALSVDEKTLYFASDMPGTLGQADIFKASINGEDDYGTPVNLGNKVNTAGRETFPSITASGDMILASDGHPGLGGLDIFVAKNKSGVFSDLTNIGEPINSSMDDFGLIMDGSKGYFTSNRTGGKGSDDIYTFKATDAKPGTPEAVAACDQNLIGTITDKGNGQPIAGAKVTLFDSYYKKVKEVMTNAEGKYDFGAVTCGSKMYLKSEKENYITQETNTLISSVSGTSYVPIPMDMLNKEVKVGDDIAKLLNIPMIYFDLDKSFIRQDAAVELTKILDVLQQNPTMEIDVRSHTDSRNTAQYNVSLSGRRVKSTIAWLVSKGISKSRITGRGYGETQLTNNCADGVQCSEDEHQKNRRSEFIITKQ